MTDKQLTKALEYLSFCQEINLFELDFKEKFVNYGMNTEFIDCRTQAKIKWSSTEAISYAHLAWEQISKVGLVNTFNELKSNKEFIRVLVHTINVE